MNDSLGNWLKTLGMRMTLAEEQRRDQANDQTQKPPTQTQTPPVQASPAKNPETPVNNN